MSSRLPLRALLAASLCATLGCSHLRTWMASGSDTRVEGRVSSPASDASRGLIAVFLERLDPAAPQDAIPAVVVGQSQGRFDPDFAVVAVGQPVLFVNRDEIFRASFSYSPPNAFECQALAPGGICMVTFRETGLVRIYSPLDSEERGALLVVPGPYHAVPDQQGSFQIDAISPGRYRATLWSEHGAESSRELSLTAGTTTRADFTLQLR